MRKLLVFFILLAQIPLFLNASPVDARSIHVSTIMAQEGGTENLFTFEQLGYKEKALVGPYDSLNLFFSLPSNASLAPGGNLFLKFNVTGANYLSEDIRKNWLGGTLLVYFNEELIDTIVLDTLGSEISKEIPIPVSALKTYVPDGRHHLQLFLSADLHCDLTDTLLLIDKNSSFTLEFQTIPPIKDLSVLPRPIYQPESILPNTAYIVVPDSPDDFELQAAMSVAAGLGSMTEGLMDLNLVTYSALSPEAQVSNHLIFVGLASKFPGLQNSNFPIALTSAGLVLNQDNDNDGVIQVADSPWSQAHVAMFVGGNSEEAVVKAGQAFSAGKIIAVEKPNVSIVRSTNPIGGTLTVAEDYTFENLGYETVTLGVFGDNYLSYNFYVTPEQAVSTGAYIDLTMAHSDLLNLDATGVTVLLNDDLVGGIRLDEKSPETIRIDLIPDVLRRGINRMEIITDMVPYFTCYSTDLQSTWVTISNSSMIHLPVSVQQVQAGEKIDLKDFPYMLLNDRNLSDLAFLLAQNDPISWDTASKVAYYVGSKGNVPLVNMLVAYSDDVPESVLKNYNLFVFGRATNLPIISQLNDSLPAPFPVGSDEAVQPEMLVNYSVLPITNVGYLELAASPYNPGKLILGVLGNTDSGIPMAGVALTKDELVSQLSGDFAVLFSDQIVTTDTRLGPSGNALVSASPAETVIQTPEAGNPEGGGMTAPQVASRPAWILPVFILITVLILIILVVMLRRESRSKSGFDDKVLKDDDPDNEEL